METTDAPLTPVGKASLAWGDLEQDGLLELLLTGEKAGSPPTPITEVYRYNAGADRFELVPGFTLPPVMEGEAAWGDYDDDGFQDVVLTGTNGGGGELTRLFLNDQSSGLLETAFSSDALIDAYAGSQVAWGDIENDGKLDLALIGQTSEGPVERTLILFQNRNEVANQLPVAPSNLNSTTNADSVVLTWNAPAQADGFTYNLVIGTAENDGDIKSPLAFLPLAANDGLPKVVGRGNASSQLSWRARGIPAGTYYWTVQSIDPDFEGSAFAQVDSFTFTPPHFTDITSIGFEPGDAAALQNGSLAWGDVDGDNDLDLFVSGETNGGNIEGIFYENLNAKDLVINATIQGDATGTRNGEADWHDYDADGDLDLLLIGEGASGATANIFEFDGTSLVAQNPAFTPLLSGKARWIDVDNDGDADVFLTGLDAGGQAVAELHLNGGKGTFTLASASFVPISAGDIAWTDVDGNSLADLITIGADASDQAVANLYLNRGNGLFTLKTNAFETSPDLIDLKLDAGDMNNDGYPDLVMVGEDDAAQPASLVYVNRGDSTAIFDLLDLSAMPLAQLTNGDVKWGDYDEDG
ncbi:MAG: VCBS repeat-containing protein, partial [Bacteroidota bacterium]